MTDACCEIVWLLAIFQVFGITYLTPMLLHCDNKSALYIASNSVFHERTKHIEVDCHLVREKLQLSIISTTHIPSASQPAYMLTKALSSHQLQLLCSKLNVCNLFQPSTLRRMLQIHMVSQVHSSTPPQIPTISTLKLATLNTSHTILASCNSLRDSCIS